MSRHRHKKKRSSDNVSLNLAAMLDMAFQLLTFFILTFRPAPIEGQLAVNLPPPVSIQEKQKVETETPADPNQPGIAAFETVNLFVKATDSGKVREIRIGPRAVVQGNLDAGQQQFLSSELKKMFALKGAFERVQIVAEGKLSYGDLMKIIEVCSQQKLPDGTFLQKISFIEQDAPEVN